MRYGCRGIYGAYRAGFLYNQLRRHKDEKVAQSFELDTDPYALLR